MYNEIFEKCGLVKDNGEYLEEYVEGGYVGVKELWMDVEDGIDFLVYEDGRIEEVCFRGSMERSIEFIEKLYAAE